MSRWSKAPQLQEARNERLPRAALKAASGSSARLRTFLQGYPNSIVDAEAKALLVRVGLPRGASGLQGEYSSPVAK
jgi:hypothetical protein